MMPERRHPVPGVPAALNHPRPLRRRDEWWPLDGEWEFATDADLAWEHPDSVVFDRRIAVPFAPETPASGVGHAGYLPRCWYRRVGELPTARRAGERLVLHFGAVDYQADVWFDGR